jgi:hypothetical protein
LQDFGDRLYMRDTFSKQTGKRFKTQQALPNNPGLVKHAPNLRVCRAHMKSQRSRSTFDQQAPASRCVYRIPKPAHNGDEARQESRVN